VRIVAWSENEPKSGDVIFANIAFESLKEGFSFLNLFYFRVLKNIIKPTAKKIMLPIVAASAGGSLLL